MVERPICGPSVNAYSGLNGKACCGPVEKAYHLWVYCRGLSVGLVGGLSVGLMGKPICLSDGGTLNLGRSLQSNNTLRTGYKMYTVQRVSIPPK
jgi:hypothetical protein